MAGLYLFTRYALRCRSAFRNLSDYLGVGVLILIFRYFCINISLAFTDIAQFKVTTSLATEYISAPGSLSATIRYNPTIEANKDNKVGEITLYAITNARTVEKKISVVSLWG